MLEDTNSLDGAQLMFRKGLQVEDYRVEDYKLRTIQLSCWVPTLMRIFCVKLWLIEIAMLEKQCIRALDNYTKKKLFS